MKGALDYDKSLKLKCAMLRSQTGFKGVSCGLSLLSVFFDFDYQSTLRVYAVVLSNGMSLPAPFPFLIKLMNTGRHVRERHRKTKSWFTLLECCLFHQDKGNNPSTPWAGLDSCLPKRLTSVYMHSFSIYNIPPLLSFSILYSPYSTWNNHQCTIPFSAICQF